MVQLNDMRKMNSQLVFRIITASVYGHLSKSSIIRSLGALHSDEDVPQEWIKDQYKTVLNALTTEEKLEEYLLDNKIDPKDLDKILEPLYRIKRDLCLAGETEQIKKSYLKFNTEAVGEPPEGYAKWEGEIAEWAFRHKKSEPRWLPNEADSEME